MGEEQCVKGILEWVGLPDHMLEHPCRKIVFTITSHDQGWGGDNPEDRRTYNNSWTWFEVGLERFDAQHCKPLHSELNKGIES